MSDTFTVPVTLHRSDAWLQAQRLKTGRNTPEYVELPVDPATLTEEAREIWLRAGSGSYQTFRTLGYREDYTLACAYCGYGKCNLRVDADVPTPAEVSSAILRAYAEVEVGRSERAMEAANRAAAAAKREAEAEAKEQEREAARMLLAEELEGLRKRATYYETECIALRAQLAKEEEEEVEA